MQNESDATVTVTDFSKTPSGRYPKDGPDNGETFRKNFLAPAFKRYQKVTVVLDGAAGFPSSFLDEAFGGLIRDEGFSGEDLHKRLTVECSENELERYISLVWRYIDRAAAHKRPH